MGVAASLVQGSPAPTKEIQEKQAWIVADLSEQASDRTWYYGGKVAGDMTQMAMGAYMLAQSAAAIAGGLSGEAGGAALTSTGAGAIVGVPAIAAATVLVASSAVSTAVGYTFITGGKKDIKQDIKDFQESKNARSKGDAETGKTTSQNQMQNQVEKGKAPKGINRVDPASPNIPDSQAHIHFGENEAALNQDGTWHDAGKTHPNLTSKQEKWILDNGWNLPSN